LAVWLVELSGLAVKKPVGFWTGLVYWKIGNLIPSCPLFFLAPFHCILSNIAVFVGLDWILLGCVGMEMEVKVKGDA
jgi:hypothetical protein